MFRSPEVWLALLILVAWVAGVLEIGWGNRHVPHLEGVAPLPGGAGQAVTVVIAARDEERGIEEALRSVLRQRYAPLEVIVVDDRSTDATGAVLDRMAGEEERLRVVHVRGLPRGWLGKNHALHVGAEAAAGEWILFTDADVVFEPTALARAVAHATARGLDHLTAAPHLVMPGRLLDVFGGFFALLFARYAKPWKARDPRSRRHVGIGAFNLVRASAYRAAGGHRPIAMRPDDDMKLGKLLKKHGFRQDVVFARELVTVEWYGSVGEAVRGLEKNAFAGLEYSLPAVVASTAALFLFGVWPFLAVPFTGGAVQALYGGSVLVMLGMYAASARVSGTSPLSAVLLPVAVLLFLYIVWRATLLTLVNRGIRWRGTHYPLDELRANRV